MVNRLGRLFSRVKRFNISLRDGKGRAILEVREYLGGGGKVEEITLRIGR